MAVSTPSLLGEIIGDAARRVEVRTATALPRSADHVRAWLRTVAGEGLEAYFLHPRAYPMLLLPWWLDRASGGPRDLALHTELAYSTMQGYLGIRLIDDVMDADPRAQPRLLAATAFFQAEFERVYVERFPAQHPFWGQFHAHWRRTADATIADASLEPRDLSDLREIATGKVRAALIPLSAAAYHAGLPGLPEGWRRLCESLAEWHQLRNDFRDWRRDLERGARTYVLAYALRERKRDEPVSVWMARAGLEWGLEALSERLAAGEQLARELDAGDALAYLKDQRCELDGLRTVVAEGTAPLQRLLIG